MLEKILDVLDRNKPWKVFRHGSSFVNLLKVLGIWPKIVVVSGIAMGVIVAYLAALPLWGKILLALVVAALLSFIYLLSVIALAVRRDSGTETKVPALVEAIGGSREPDESTLQALQALLPTGDIAQLRVRQFWSDFKWEFDNVLIAFQQWGLVAEHRFLDYELEEIHRRLRDAVSILFDKVHRYSEPLPGGGDARGFSPIGQISDMAEFEGHRNEVYEAARRVCTLYDDLVLTARRKSAGIIAPPSSQIRRPKVVATKYDGLPSGAEALYLHNEGETAHEVRVEELRIGEWMVQFEDTLPLLKTDGHIRVTKMLKVTNLPNGTRHMDILDSLDHVWNDAQKEHGTIERKSLRIRYRDFDQNPYGTVCTIERDVSVRGAAPFRIVDCRDEPVQMPRPLPGTYNS
jgi:hypothetical protein